MIVWTDTDTQAPRTGPLALLGSLTYLVTVLIAAPVITYYGGVSPGWAFPLGATLAAPWFALAMRRGWMR